MADEVLLWCDVRKNIGVLQFILGLKGPGKEEKSRTLCTDTTTAEITVYSDCVVVKKKENANGQVKKVKKSGDSQREIRILFRDVKVDPMTCNGLSLVQDTELQIRLRISKGVESNSQNIFSQEMNGYSFLLDKERRSLRQGPVDMFCRLCMDNIIEKMEFNRVLELPSELWQQTSLNLCCHGTVTNLSSLQEGSLNPEEKDCLLGSYFIMVHSSAVQPKHLDTQGDTVIKCHRCSWPIGDQIIQYDSTCIDEYQVKGIRLNKHAITTQGTNDIFREYTTELYLSRLLYSKLQGKVNFKFLVKTVSQKGTSQTYALLWILNPDAAIITNVCPPTNKHIDEQSIEESNDTSEENKAQLIKGMKILYKVLLNTTAEEINKLPGRASMETLILPQETFGHLVLLLTGSTYTLPPSQRKVEGFSVGYLKK